MNERTYTSLLAPVVTEKSTQVEDGKYAFYVSPRATKKHIKDAVLKVYGAEVAKVNIIKSPAKTRWGRGRKPVVKRDKAIKAIVTLKDKTKKIDVKVIK